MRVVNSDLVMAGVLVLHGSATGKAESIAEIVAAEAERRAKQELAKARRADALCSVVVVH